MEKKHRLIYSVWFDNKNKTYDTDDEFIMIYEGYDKEKAADIEYKYNAVKEIAREKRKKTLLEYVEEEIKIKEKQGE